MEYRGTLSKQKLEKTLEYNTSSPLKSPPKRQRSNFMLDISHGESKKQTQLKSAAELVKEIINPVIDDDFE